MNFAQTFKALSNPIRRSILELLKAGKLSAGDIAGHFWCSRSDHFHHLSLLKQADLIREEKRRILSTMNSILLSWGFNGLASLIWKETLLMKTNKKLLLLTSMVILFPMLWGWWFGRNCLTKSRFTSTLLARPITSNRNPWLCLVFPFSILMVHLFMIF